jgi:hypothetical protein
MSKFLKVMIVLLTIAALATPAMADFSVYGSARMTTFYNDISDGAGVPGADSNSMTWALQGNSRFGMKASNGAVSGQYEVGTSGSVRVLTGTYKFDGGNFLIGQTYTPYTNFAEQVHGVDNDLVGYGATYDGRKPMLKLTLDNGFGVALISYQSSAATDADANMPKVAAFYSGKAGEFSYKANLAYQAGDVYDAYLATFGGSINLAPAMLHFNVAYGQNPAEFGLLLGTSNNEHISANAADDTVFIAGYVEAAFKVADNQTLRAGLGYATEDNDSAVQTETRMSFYVHDQITIAPGFFIVPEFSYYDGLDNANGADGEKSYHVGAKWQINF